MANIKDVTVDNTIFVLEDAFHSRDESKIIVSNIDMINRLKNQTLIYDNEICEKAWWSYSVDYYLSQVNNGGIAQFMTNSQWLKHTIEDINNGLRAMDCPNHLNLFNVLCRLVQKASWPNDNETFDFDANIIDRLLEKAQMTVDEKELLTNYDTYFSSFESLQSKNANWLKKNECLKVINESELELFLSQVSGEINVDILVKKGNLTIENSIKIITLLKQKNVIDENARLNQDVINDKKIEIITNNPTLNTFILTILKNQLTYVLPGYDYSKRLKQKIEQMPLKEKIAHECCQNIQEEFVRFTAYSEEYLPNNTVCWSIYLLTNKQAYFLTELNYQSVLVCPKKKKIVAKTPLISEDCYFMRLNKYINKSLTRDDKQRLLSTKTVPKHLNYYSLKKKWEKESSKDYNALGYCIESGEDQLFNVICENINYSTLYHRWDYKTDKLELDHFFSCFKNYFFDDEWSAGYVMFGHVDDHEMLFSFDRLKKAMFTSEKSEFAIWNWLSNIEQGSNDDIFENYKNLYQGKNTKVYSLCSAGFSKEVYQKKYKKSVNFENKQAWKKRQVKNYNSVNIERWISPWFKRSIHSKCRDIMFVDHQDKKEVSLIIYQRID